MASIVIWVNGIGALENTSDIFVGGWARTSDMTNEDIDITWQVQVAVTDVAATINDAIKTAAVAAAVTAGHTIGALDIKTVMGGALAA